MARISIVDPSTGNTNVTEGGMGSFGSFYYLSGDEAEVRNQSPVDRVKYIPVIMNIAKAGQPIGLQVTAMVALDGNNNPLMGNNDLIALPCPPYCGTD